MQSSFFSDCAVKAWNSFREHFYEADTSLYREHVPSKPSDPPHCFVWPYSGVMTAVNALADIQAVPLDLVQSTCEVLEQYWNPAGPVAGYDSHVMSYGSDGRFYDDNEWLGMALLRASILLGDDELRTRAKRAYVFSASGWTDDMGGGVFWKEGLLNTKNTCSNGPLAVLALQLNEVDPQPEYVALAEKVLDWVARLRDPESGVYFDALTSDGTINRTTWTYNAGSVLHAKALLYLAKGRQEDLEDAIDLARSSRRHFIRQLEGGVELPASPWFNVVLLRGLLALRRIREATEAADECIDGFKQFIRQAWDVGPDSRGLFGANWLTSARDEAGHRAVLDHVAMVESAALLAADAF